MSDEIITNRKDEHIDIALKENVEGKIGTWFDCINFIHTALPETDLHKIQVKTRFLGREFSAPLLIEGMTGGTPRGAKINEQLAKAARELNIPMMVGSQRIAIEKPETEWTFRIARESGEDIFLIANIGAAQITTYTLDKITRIISMIDADALAIHLNPLQESVQPEGDTDFTGVLDRIDWLSRELSVPIIVKETGAGISYETAKMLLKTKVKAIDVSGSGGTSWSAIEVYRARKVKDDVKEHLGTKFWNWGIPTAASVVEVRAAVGKEIQVIASGGIRDGVDAAKAISLGADMVGMARPVLKALDRGYNHLLNFLNKTILEIRNVVFLTGSKSLKELRKKPIVVFPPLAYWLEARGFRLEEIRDES